ncbi:MAG TPA: M14 family zinc carboxypeptidase, partial [Blastocatellia bacterium]|nr:M14 family zinc carboxypeptidase [Blastocatellia bacterium]
MKRRLAETAFLSILLCVSLGATLSNSATAEVGPAGAHKPVLSELGRATSETVPSPADVLGFKPGDDRKLAAWPQIVGYFQKLAGASHRVLLQEPGFTTEHRPFIYALISSEENIRNINSIRDAQRKLADPRLIRSDAERQQLIRDTPAVVAITCSIHSTEIGASQMSMELAYRLATDDSPRTSQILNNVVLLLV